MRILALVALLMSLAAAGWAGQIFWQEWQVSHAPIAPRAPGAAPEDAPQPPATALPPRQWPLLFGEKMPPLPPEPEEAKEPEPPAPKAPPIDALGYTLKGVVRAEGQVWAMVSHATGDEVLRVGDELTPGMIISKIDERGLWAGAEGAEPALLGFPEDRRAGAQ